MNDPQDQMTNKVKMPASLCQSVAAGEIVPFVGAGASLSVKRDLFPSWTGVLERLEQELESEGREPEKTLVRTYTNLGRLFDAAGEAYKSLGHARFAKVMVELFHKAKPADADLSLHKLIWEVNPDLVLTTNYDSALEWANEKATPILNANRSDLAGIASQSRRQMSRVWHLHGYIADSESLILAPSQYDRLYVESTKDTYEAARKQLHAIVANRPLLFVGFSLEDRYVMEMLEKVLNCFAGSLASSYALFRSGDGDSESLWEKHNIQVLEYENHGADLTHLIEGVLKDKRDRTSKTSVAMPTQQESGSTIESDWPGCRIQRAPANSESFLDLFRVLEDNFAFRWERESFEEQTNPIVYWPVRLREPSAIHAVQSFAAAALQRQGARVILCLDDFGDKKYEASRFIKRVHRWISKVGGKSDQLESRTFKNILNTRDPQIAWNHVQKWLGGESYKLEKVLLICKLYKVGMGLEEYMSKGTGRLLTPGVVWACLKHLIDEFPGSSLLTLGGHDECNLWQAWRERISEGDPLVGHLYIPELSNTHMETTNLRWKAKSDVQRTLELKLGGQDAETDWRSENAIVPWSLAGCVFSPEYLTDPKCVASKIIVSAEAESSTLMRPTVDAVANWVLE
ncbi:hypothetical protein K227x_37280 [Rubripirellula lacrimiformis]|uniref:Uncharacterized protein n=1 Tax=Rubripirellula lacrimiformis TaxID=1930273 RepID=A0A517NE37_9BACT|nr:SIR2 family protein [Rubripirellula lacrimiformis]QDT05328.1 hypothetical protein K227x_37280 [Rubripirellula lacrimiformis]